MNDEQQRQYDREISLLYKQNFQPRAVRSVIVQKMRRNGISEAEILTYTNNRFASIINKPSAPVQEEQEALYSETITEEYFEDDNIVPLIATVVEDIIIEDEFYDDDF